MVCPWCVQEFLIEIQATRCVDFAALSVILVEKAGSPDDTTRLTSIKWLKEFVSMARTQLVRNSVASGTGSHKIGRSQLLTVARRKNFRCTLKVTSVYFTAVFVETVQAGPLHAVAILIQVSLICALYTHSLTSRIKNNEMNFDA